MSDLTCFQSFKKSLEGIGTEYKIYDVYGSSRIEVPLDLVDDHFNKIISVYNPIGKLFRVRSSKTFMVCYVDNNRQVHPLLVGLRNEIFIEVGTVVTCLTETVLNAMRLKVE